MRRKEYTKDKVKQLRVQRNLLKASDRNMQDMYALKVGKLRAAGHFAIGGFTKLIKSEHAEYGIDNGKIYETSVSFRTMQKNGNGDAPHISGYLVSASDADKGKYRLKGWFNEDGTIRIELVD
jgi:predicted RNA-binding protein with TRAM domain